LAVLGASNVWLALPQIVDHVAARGGDCDLWVAGGPGRSWGTEAGVAGITWRGLSRCGLVADLERRMEAAGATSGGAVLADIGNDIPYGHSVDDILGWVTTAVRDARSAGLRVAVAGLPVAALDALPRWRFEIVRRILFPFRALRLSDAQREVHALETALRALCAAENVEFLPTSPHWYGIDPIHIRSRLRREVFGAWIDRVIDIDTNPADASLPDSHPARRRRLTSIRLRWQPTACARIFGARRRREPAAIEAAPGVNLHLR